MVLIYGYRTPLLLLSPLCLGATSEFFVLLERRLRGHKLDLGAKDSTQAELVKSNAIDWSERNANAWSVGMEMTGQVEWN